MASNIEITRFKGSNGVALVGDVAGPEDGRPILLLHGGGQTRGSWKNGLLGLAGAGYRVHAVDARGHGDSDWSPDGEYALDAMADDLAMVIDEVGGEPVVVGASMGGMTGLVLLGRPDAPPARALVLVDIAPRFNREGTARIERFMNANPEGFASLEEAGAAVAAYNTHRPPPDDLSGLKRNLREVEGRYYWHWDPRLMQKQSFDPGDITARLESAAKAIDIPMLLVRGRQSDVLTDAEVEHFRKLVPDARFSDIAGAGHMIAGDRNDAFNGAILDFLAELDREGA